MRRLRVAIIGFGRLGKACAEELQHSSDLELAGIVRRQESPGTLPSPFHDVAVARHIGELKTVHAALICVPTPNVRGVSQELLQHRVPIVECARLEGRELADHYAALDTHARHHKVAAIVGAGWDPGVLTLMRHIFDVLIPKGHTEIDNRPGVSLHRTAVTEEITGIKDALATEYRASDGKLVHYVYVELDKKADINSIKQNIETEPAFVGEQVLILPVESVAALEESGHGVVVERRGTATTGPHPSLLLEARFDVYTFAARIMVDAVLALPSRRAGAQPYRYASTSPFD